MPSGGIGGSRASAADSTADEYQSQGCFGDSSSSRKVPNALTVSGGMTIYGCANAAKAAGYTVFSLGAGNLCFGGSDLALAKSLGSSSACASPCTGDPTKTCGGASASSVYTFKGTVTPTSTCSDADCYAAVSHDATCALTWVGACYCSHHVGQHAPPGPPLLPAAGWLLHGQRRRPEGAAKRQVRRRSTVHKH